MDEEDILAQDPQTGEPVFEEVKYTGSKEPVFEDIKYSGDKPVGKPIPQVGGKISSKLRLKGEATKLPPKNDSDLYDIADPNKGKGNKAEEKANAEMQAKYKKDNPNLSKKIAEETAKANLEAQAAETTSDYDRQNPYAQYSKTEIVDDGKGNKIEVDADNFVADYFDKDKLKASGIDPKDFDGYLEKTGKKQSFKDFANRGLFTEGGSTNFLGQTQEEGQASLAFDLGKLKLLNDYLDETTAADKKALSLFIQQKNAGVQNLDNSYNAALSSLEEKNNKYRTYIKENLPAFNKHEEEKVDKLKEQYKKYKEGHADEFLNWGRGAWEGAVQGIHGLSATIYDKLGADDTADQIRMQKEQEARYTAVPNLYYMSGKGKTVEYKGTKYMYTKDGDILDLDDKINATGVLESSDYQAIKDKAEKEGVEDSSYSVGGALQQTSGVMGDMAVQLLLTRGVSGGRVAAGAVAGELATKSGVTGVIENTLLKSGFSASPLVTKLSRVPSLYGDVLITQGAYGYSNGYETTYTAMRDAGHPEQESKEIASEAGTQMAALYGATAFIAPQTHILTSLEGNSIKSLIRKGVATIEKDGVEGFKNTLKEGTKGILDKLSNVKSGALKSVEEAGKEVAQENIQQYSQNTMVNANINDLAGEDLLKETYTMEDFKETTAMAFGAALLMNSPSMLKGMDKMDILSKLSNQNENFQKSLDHYVSKGLATKEQAATLKNEVEIFTKYKNLIPAKTNNDIAFEAMNRLNDIDNIQVQMNNVHDALKDAYKERIVKAKGELNELLYGKKEGVQSTESKSTSSKEGEVNNRETKKTEEENVELPSVVEEYKAKLAASKELNPTTFWSVDMPSDEVLTKAVENDKLIETDGGFGIVKEDGDITGLYKFNPESKGVAKAVLAEAVQKGGVKLDNYDTGGLVENYEKAGFKVASRVSFDENLQPEGYDKETHGTPDVVAMVYDPNNELGILEKKVGTYEEALAYRDTYVDAAKSLLSSDETIKPTKDSAKPDYTPAPVESNDSKMSKVVNKAVEQGRRVERAFQKNNRNSALAGIKDMFRLLPIANRTSPAVKKIIREAIKVDMSNDSAIKNLMENLYRHIESHSIELDKKISKAEKIGRKIERSFTNKNKAFAVANVKALVEQLSKNSTVGSTVLKSMLKGAVKLDVNNEAAVGKFMERVSRTVESANDKLNTKEVRGLKRKVKNLSKTAPANVRELGKAAGLINENYLTSEDLDKYKQVLSDIAISNTPVQGNNQAMVDVDLAYKTLEELSNKVEDAKIQEVKDSLEFIGLDPMDLGMSDAQLKDFWDTEINTDSATVDEKRSAAIDKAEKVKEKLRELAEVYKSTLSGFNFDELKTAKSKDVAKTLGQANLAFMDAVSLKEYIKAVQNVTTNETVVGAGKIAAEIKATNGMVKFINLAIKSGIPLGNIKLETKFLSGNPLNDLKSLSLYMKEVFKSPELMGEFNYYSGLDSLGKGKTKTEKEFDALTRRLDRMFNILSGTDKTFNRIAERLISGESVADIQKDITELESSKKDSSAMKQSLDLLKGKTSDEIKAIINQPVTKDLRSSDNTVLRGIVANLIQGNTPEEFEIAKARMEDHLRKVNRMTSFKRTTANAELAQKIYNEYKGFASQEEVLNYLKSKNDGNYELINFWINEFASIKEALKENTEVTHNEIFNEVNGNYLPIKIKVDGSLNMDEAGSTYNFGGVAAPKQAATTVKRNSSKKLPVNGVLDLDFDAAMFNRYKMGITDINNASSLQQVKSFFKNPAITNLMGVENTQAFIKRVNYMQRISSGSLNETSDVERTVGAIERVFKRIGVTAALGGVTAIVKQTIPVVSGIAVQVGAGNFGMFLGNFRAAQNNSLIENYSTSRRGASMLGTKSIVEGVGEINKYKGFSGKLNEVSRKSGQLFDKTRNIFMTPLKIGDEMVAKAAWATYYLEYLKKQGYDLSKIDLSTENEFIDNDEIRQKAASYAEVRIEETQVASDSERSATLFSNPHIGISALRSMFLPFQQFNLNTKMRMVLDVSEILNKGKYKKLAVEASNMSTDEMIQRALEGTLDLNNSHVSQEGLAKSQNLAWKSLGATIAEQIMFQGIKTFALALVTGNTAMLFKFLIDDSDDEGSDSHEEWMSGKIDWAFKLKQFYSNLVKDLNPIAIGNYAEDSQIDGLNRLAYLSSEDKDEFETYKQWADQYVEDNGSLPWYKYDKGDKANYGLYSIPLDIYSAVSENADYAYDGEAHVINDWGKEEKHVLQNESQLRFMRAMFMMEVLRSTTGVEADSYRELEKVRKELVKITKVKKDE